jgi:3-ketosteroid 9alpha-monooxygenase subunit B
VPELRYHQLRVAEVIAETEDARSIVFELRPDQADAFQYRPGQYLTLHVPSVDRDSVARCYSLSSSPYAGPKLQVTVKRTLTGYASNWIHDNVRPRTVVDVLPPGGVFSPRSLDEDFLCFAGGSGITPVLSIITSALLVGTGRTVLVYANRDERSVIFRDRLAELVAEHPDRLTVLHWLESVQGLPSVATLCELARPYAAHEAFVCGPPPFMTAVTTALTELDLPQPRVHVERFLSLVKNPFRKATAAVEVELDGARHTLA